MKIIIDIFILFIRVKINKYYNKLKNIEKNSILSISDLNIENIQLQEIKCIEAYSINPYYNSFIIFTSPCNNIQYLIFITKNNSIISYNLDTNIILSEIKEFQSQNIMRLDYIFDKKNKRDLLMAYCLLNCIIIYDIRNWNIIISLEKVNDFGVLNSACFLFDKRDEEIFIILYFLYIYYLIIYKNFLFEVYLKLFKWKYFLH